TQADIVQIAGAFSGWRFDFRSDQIYFDDDEHEYSGSKDIYATTGGFGSAQSFASADGSTEVDSVTDIIFQHHDSDGKNTVARRTTKRLLEFFCHGGWATIDTGKKAIIDELVDTSSFDVDFDVQALLRAIFTHDAFYETAAQAPFSASTPKS